MSATLTETSVGDIEFRSGTLLPADVSYPKRIVTCIAMPYEQPTEIFEGGKVFTEVVSRSAFAGIEKRPHKVKANRDHDGQRLVGGAVAFHPSRAEGLVAELKISKTILGDETLELAADGWLDVSAGFQLLRRGPEGTGPVWEDAELWERNRTVRRLNRLHLDHVAFVPNPAYRGAVVTDTRDAAVRPQEPLSREDRPNMVSYHVQTLLTLEADMNRRYTR